jgi:glycosyltransferase involved in cell wall biosynthesis
VTVSHHRRTQLSALFGLPEEEIGVVPPGVEVQDLYKLDLRTKDLVRKHGLLDGEPLILLPARITRRKNIQFAIRVVAALREAWPSVKLIVTGPPGPHNPANRAYLDSLQDLRSQAGLQDRVLFLYELGGRNKPLYITDAMMADFFQLADLLLFPSLREGFGIPALEAGLFRLPIVASDIPPIRESTGQHGHYFDPRGEPAEVAKQIDQILRTDSAYQMRRRVLAQYTWPAILDRYLLPLLESLDRETVQNDPK